MWAFALLPAILNGAGAFRSIYDLATGKKNKATLKWPYQCSRGTYLLQGNLPARKRKIVSAAGSVAYLLFASAQLTYS